MSDAKTLSPMSQAPLEDAGYRCPKCAYNLTGLPEARCPECGAAFDWQAVRRGPPPTIAFERARGWGKLRGFLLTWLTVLFAPWIFARQAIRRLGTRNGLLFGAVCFLLTGCAFVSDMDLNFWAAWLCTALLYVVFQVVLLSLLDWSGWRRPAETLRFWLLISCYASAVMLTEFIYGPPQLILEEIWDFVRARNRSSWPDMFNPSIHTAVYWTQLIVWSACLGACYAARLRRKSHSPALIWSMTALMILSMILLYATTVQFVGMYFFELFDL